MSKREKKKHIEQENKESINLQEPVAVYEMGYKKGQRLRGFLEIFAGALLLCLGLWLWSRTWGTILLFTNAAIGRMVRYYWIVLIVAAIILIIGFLTMRKVRIEKKSEVIKKEEEDKTLVKDETAKDEEETLILSDAVGIDEGEKQNEPGGEKAAETDPMIPANKCPGCGKDKKTGAAFCIYCGYKF